MCSLMSALFDICCIKNPKGSVGVPSMESVEQMNGYSEKCPLTEDPDSKSEPELKSVKPNLRIKLPQPIKLKNHLFQDENSDLLHSKIGEVTSINTKCSEKVCQSSIMEIPGRGHVPRTPDQIAVDADAFLKQYFASIRRENSPAHIARIREIKQELSETGTYQLKTSELVFGAKLAWRNSSRCIGRIQWKKLQIFDCREVTRASGMFEALCNHIKYATNKGNIRSAITIFPQRTDGKHDYRIWNPQLISYAGYKQPDGTILGDPAKVEITEICVRLGWKPKYTAWDVLPLVLQADGQAPEFFDLPKEIIMEVHMEHPQFDWFKELGLRWYAVPAVSNMSFDCGGLEFTATAFNGWYMGTEVGCRNLSDTNRYNVLQNVASKMGLDTNIATSLWKDRALVEVNIAVLHSYHRDNVSIVDHHTASDQFMKHLDAEYKQRGGCPADWIWVVPPMSSSILPVFHQEMALYYLKPSYDYQDPAWKNYQWPTADGEKPVKRKFHFKQIARAVKFTSKLFTRALSKRIKATILYASETGKSEHYAKELGIIFGHAFNAQVQCMSEYDMFSIEHETLLLIVTSTFGNGEPPANGTEFADHLFEMLCNEQRYQSDPMKDSSAGILKLPSPKALMRTNSIMSPTVEFKTQLSRLESLKSSAAASSVENIGPLSNVCYAVFALGSSAYPKFCNFGKTVDKLLEELGGERILEIGTGDELYGQEQQFNLWASKIFHVACETFCIEDDEMVKDAKLSFHKTKVKEDTVRFTKPNETKVSSIKEGLEMCFKKQISKCHVKEVSNLGNCCDERATIFVNIKSEDDIKYEPGDHLGVMPCNKKEIVDVILARLRDIVNFDKPVQLQLMREILSPTGVSKVWENHDRIPAINVRDIFTRFLDITTPPNTAVLKHLANSCTDPEDAKHIQELIQDSSKYDDWKHYYYPHLAEVLEQFPSCRPQSSLLTVLLPALQPRFYSISSSLLAHPKEIHLTVAIVRYKTQDGKGPMHHGVCSAYLQSLTPGEEIFSFIRRAPSFHMPKDISAPLILVGPGTGIAPFRGFWHHRSQQAQMDGKGKKLGKVILFFGCRNRGLDLYKEEKEKAISEGVLSQSLIAYSREDNIDKKYVQALLEERGEEITSCLVDEEGHFYVCGDCKMAEDVQQKLKGILKKHAKMNDDEVENYILTLMDENRYHEDIFGITLRTAEVHSASRESAKRTRLESEKSQALPEVVIN